MNDTQLDKSSKSENDYYLWRTICKINKYIYNKCVFNDKWIYKWI